MKILMKSLASGPDGHLREGEAHDVDRETGRQLVACGAAAPDGPEARAEFDAAQAAFEASREVPEGPETAALKSKGKRA